MNDPLEELDTLAEMLNTVARWASYGEAWWLPGFVRRLATKAKITLLVNEAYVRYRAALARAERRIEAERGGRN